MDRETGEMMKRDFKKVPTQTQEEMFAHAIDGMVDSTLTQEKQSEENTSLVSELLESKRPKFLGLF